MEMKKMKKMRKRIVKNLMLILMQNKNKTSRI